METGEVIEDNEIQIDESIFRKKITPRLTYLKNMQMSLITT